VIDGDSFTHRSYHAVPKTIMRKGNRPAGAIIGFANFLLRLYLSEQPRAVLVGWDTLDAPTYRHKAFAAYQGGRQFDPEILEQLAILPEFVALLLALSVYTGAFIAEIVRGGILAVSHGQSEAAHALGLSTIQTTRLVVLPQALRIIVPPLTSQYLNLTKNSSLAVAIGYPDLVNVFMGTVQNQTGHPVETIAMTMAFYLAISLLISLFMNWYNRRIALVER